MTAARSLNDTKHTQQTSVSILIVVLAPTSVRFVAAIPRHLIVHPADGPPVVAIDSAIFASSLRLRVASAVLVAFNAQDVVVMAGHDGLIFMCCSVRVPWSASGS